MILDRSHLSRVVAFLLVAWSPLFTSDGNAETLASPRSAPAAFASPPDSAIPNDEFGKTVRAGQSIFNETGTYAAAFVGNPLKCASCHLDGGRLAHSAPLGAAYVSYPAYRPKNGHVNTFAERLQECFRYSMNGTAPPLGDPVLVALESYAFFLAKGAPTGETITGRGYPQVPAPAQAMDFARGAAVFKNKCAVCHGADGLGQKAQGETIFPALWGAESFNWGAGMESVKNAAGFIKANMPLGQGYSLSDQDAWDVAVFVDSHDRPQDPRFLGTVEATKAKFHDPVTSMYGKIVDGVTLGSQSPPSGPRVGSKAPASATAGSAAVKTSARVPSRKPVAAPVSTP